MGLAQQVAFSALLAFFPAVVLLIGLLGLFGTGAFDEVEHLRRQRRAERRHRRRSSWPRRTQPTTSRARRSPSSSARRRALGRERRDGRGDQGREPRLRPHRDAAVLEAAPDRDRARPRDRPRPGRDVPADRLRRPARRRDRPTRPASATRSSCSGTSLAGRSCFAAVLFFFALVYYLAPNMRAAQLAWLTPGSLVGAAVWLALSGLFALYTSFAGSYSRTYGSLAGGDHPAALAQLLRVGDPLRGRAERRARPPGRHPRGRRARGRGSSARQARR